MISNEGGKFLSNEILRLDLYPSEKLALDMLLCLVRTKLNYSDAFPLEIGETFDLDTSKFEGVHPELIVGVYELPNPNTIY